MPDRSLADGTSGERQMHTQHRRWFLTFLAVSFYAVTLGTLPVAAEPIDDLRSTGVVGERYDGFAVVREAGAPPQARALVDRVNAQRRQIYTKRAAQEGVTADQVGRVYAQQIFRNAPKGTWFLRENGSWTQK